MHYFIEHTLLPTQDAADGFGPDSTNPTNVFNCTSRFQLTQQAHAFACQNGQVIVQQSVQHSDLVNLILKPFDGLNVGHRNVKYYIYRGLLKTGFEDNGAVVNPTNPSELISNLWGSYNSYKLKINDPNLAVPPPENFGYDNTLSSVISVEEVFGNELNAKSMYVLEGESIGEFTAVNGQKIGFEVIMESNLLDITIDDLRQEKLSLNVAGMTGMEEKKNREIPLACMDPAALFGLHYHTKVYTSTYSGNTKTTVDKTGAQIYTLLVSPFVTKNRVYLDIRSENGKSYTYHNNYEDTVTGNHIKVGNSGTTPVAMPYAESSWPIKFIDTSVGNIKINLWIGDNLKPLLYTPNKKVFHSTRESKYYGKSDLKYTNSVTWSKPVNFYFPHTGGNNVAYVIGLDYFRQDYNTVLPVAVPKNQYYYDSAFCSIDIPKLGDTQTTDNWHVIGSDRKYIRQTKASMTDGTGDFAYAAENGAYWDPARVVFYSQRTQAFFRSDKEFLNTFTQKLDLLNNRYMQSKLRRNMEIVCFEYEIDPGGGQANIFVRIPGVNYYKPDAEKAKEHCLLFGLTIAELTAVKAVVGLSPHSDRHIFLEPDQVLPEEDVNTKRYWTYTVKVQGLDVNEDRVIVTPQMSGSPITVYSRDKLFFSSQAFASTEPLTTGLNRIEFNIYQNGTIRLNDNLDLSLLHMPGTNPDILFERIYYKYHDRDGNITDICNLEVRQIDGRSVGSKYNVPQGCPHLKYYSIDVSATESFLCADGTIVTEGNGYVTRKYELSGKKAFLVHFVENLVENNDAAPTRIDFNWKTSTQRYYFKPEVAAAFIGTLLEIGNVETIDQQTQQPTYTVIPIHSDGCSYEDGTSWPSATHVNGQAVDTDYRMHRGQTNDDQDQLIIDAQNNFGFTDVIRGHLTTMSGLTGARVDGPPSTLHNTHLHSGGLILR